MDFQDLKKIALERCKNAGACSAQFTRVFNCENETELLQIFVDNASWALNIGIADGTFIHENFSDEAKNAVGVYTVGVHRITEGDFFAFHSANVKAYGSANVKAYGSANVKAYGSANVEAYGSANVKAYGSANVEAYGSANVEAYANSYVENCTEREILPQSDYAIVKDYYAHKIYIKKSKFEIVEVE